MLTGALSNSAHSAEYLLSFYTQKDAESSSETGLLSCRMRFWGVDLALLCTSQLETLFQACTPHLEMDENKCLLNVYYALDITERLTRICSFNPLLVYEESRTNQAFCARSQDHHFHTCGRLHPRSGLHANRRCEMPGKSDTQVYWDVIVRQSVITLAPISSSVIHGYFIKYPDARYLHRFLAMRQPRLIMFPFDLLAQQILVEHDESLVGGETRSAGRAHSRSREDFSGG